MKKIKKILNVIFEIFVYYVFIWGAYITVILSVTLPIDSILIFISSVAIFLVAKIVKQM